MKKNLILLNVGLLLYPTGLLSAIAINFAAGAILVLIAALIITFAFASYLYTSFRNKTFWTLDTLIASLAMLVMGELFIQGYSIVIGMSLFGLPYFFQIHAVFGFLLLGIFVWASIRSAKQITLDNSRYALITIISVASLISLIGYLSFAGVLHVSVKLIYQSYIFLTFAYFLFFLFTPERKTDRKQFQFAILIVLLMVLLWIFNWVIPEVIPAGIVRVIFQFGFVPVIVLPISILLLKRNYFLFPFLIYGFISQIYFLSFSKDFRHLTLVGVNGCVGYDDAPDYPVNQHPGVSISTLLSPPEDAEIVALRQEWQQKDFTAKDVRVEYREQNMHGDSIQVISHTINGLKHYGLVRIPPGLDVKSAPILLVLNGGGADVDVLETDVLYRIASASCRSVLNHYVVVAPSFRGDIVRGKNFCFRSQGYTGDVWAGPAEDAALFLEAVKKLYNKEANTQTIAIGISRGATVALILSGLTDKITHAIAISTHADFLSEDVFRNERVGGDFPKVFFTPRDTPENIRKKLLTSSPLYFAEHIRSFEVHQGTADHLTTVRHARAIENRLKELNAMSNAKFYFYEGQGHGADDDAIVCQSMRHFSGVHTDAAEQTAVQKGSSN